MVPRAVLATSVLALSACAAPTVVGQGSTAYAPVPEARRSPDPRDRFGWSRAPGLSDHAWEEWFSIVFGERNLAPFLPGGQSQLVTGIELWGAPRDAWLGFEVGLFASAPWDGSLDDWADSINGFPDEELTDPGPDTPTVAGSSTVEFSLGLRKELELFGGRLRPFVGGGLSALRTRSFEAQGANGSDDADGSLGLYGQAGFGWVFANGSRIGLAWRAFDGPEIEVAGRRGQSDYDSWSLSFGSAF